jgi:hypothetical protein
MKPIIGSISYHLLHQPAAPQRWRAQQVSEPFYQVEAYYECDDHSEKLQYRVGYLAYEPGELVNGCA